MQGMAPYSATLCQLCKGVSGRPGGNASEDDLTCHFRLNFWPSTVGTADFFLFAFPHIAHAAKGQSWTVQGWRFDLQSDLYAHVWQREWPWEILVLQRVQELAYWA